MKKCPFCAEEIQDEAIKCKHCGEMLEVKPKKSVEEVKQPIARSKEEGLPTGATLIVFVVVIIIVVVVGIYVENSQTEKSSSQKRNRISTVAKKPKENKALKVADVYAEQILEWAFYNRPGEMKGWGIRINELRSLDYKDLMEQLYDLTAQDGTHYTKYVLNQIFGYDNIEPILYILNNYQEWKKLKGF